MIISFCLLLLTTIDDPPDQLKRIEQSRGALTAGSIEWVSSSADRPQGPWYYTSRFGGQDNLLVTRGDEEGVLTRRTNGVPAWSGPHYSLLTGSQIWQYRDGVPQADLFKRKNADGALPDMRSLGLSYVFSTSDPPGTIWDDHVSMASPRKYTTRTEGNFEIIAAETDHGRISWWLDRTKGGHPVRVILEQEGQIVNESRSSLKQYGSVWYPESVQFFKQNYKHGKEPYEVVRVQEAAFNQPDMPTQILPEDIGIDAGMNVNVYVEQKGLEFSGRWDGKQVISDEAFIKRVHKGELKSGPMFQYACEQTRAREAALAASPVPVSQTPTGASDLKTILPETYTESEWEKYTRLFIAKYQLAKEQEEQALRVLRNCQGKARDYISRHKDQFAEIDKRAADKTPADPQEQASARARLAEERRKLLEPVQQIFEKELKPGLEKIPTRAQRAKVEEKNAKKN